MKFFSRVWRKEVKPFSASLLVLLFPLLLLLAGESVQDETITNTNIRSDSRTEKIEIGNSKTNNYNIKESNYAPTQLTQVVLNVPKVKKLRKNRPPTQEEFAIKRRILDVFAEAKKERITGAEHESEPNSGSTQHTDHLERILRALNPKYIATERVHRVAFADPSDPDPSVSLPELPEQPAQQAVQTGNSGGSQQQQERLRLGLEFAESVEEQLERMDHVIREHVEWSDSFIGELANTPDEQLTPQLIAYKHLLLCLADQSKCPTNDRVIKIVQQQPPVSPSFASPSSPEAAAAAASSAFAQLSDSIAGKLPPQALGQAKIAVDRVAIAQEQDPLEMSGSDRPPSTFIEPPWKQTDPRTSSWAPQNNWAMTNQPQAPSMQPSAPQMRQPQQMMHMDPGQQVFHGPQGGEQLMINRYAPVGHQNQNQNQHKPAHGFQRHSLAGLSKGIKLSGLRFKDQAERFLSPR